jgi:hypothetical protein
MKTNVGSGIGDAWQSLAFELERQLRELDPNAEVQAGVGADGFLRLEVRTIPSLRSRARALGRSYEEHAMTVCEQCGAPVGSARAGPVVTILCGRHSPAD